MKLPFDTPQIIEYRCNICGDKNQLENHQFNRERTICKKCGINARFRGIIRVLVNLLREGGDIPIQECRYVRIFWILA
jgi:hypothetical protein